MSVLKKFSVVDLAIGLLIAAPLLALAIISYNPTERAAVKIDEQSRNVVSSLGKAAAIYKDKTGVYPSSPQDLVDKGVVDWTPENPQSYVFDSDNNNVVIYVQAESLAWREYCSGETTNILYSYVNDKTDLVCSAPDLDNLRFVN